MEVTTGNGIVYKTYGKYLDSPEWEEKKEEYYRYRFERDIPLERHCEYGGCPHTFYLNVHHITYRRCGKEAMSDLMSLCKPCHQMVHDKINNTPLDPADITDEMVNSVRYALGRGMLGPRTEEPQEPEYLKQRIKLNTAANFKWRHPEGKIISNDMLMKVEQDMVSQICSGKDVPFGYFLGMFPGGIEREILPMVLDYCVKEGLVIAILEGPSRRYTGKGRIYERSQYEHKSA